MKRLYFALLISGALSVLASCGGRECIRCIEISGTDAKELCSSDQNERHYFIQEWTYEGYNCTQTEE